MIKDSIRLARSHVFVTVALGLGILLMVTACGAPAAPAAPAPKATLVAAAPTAAGVKPAPNATPAPQAKNPTSKLDCTAIYKANAAFGRGLAMMVNLTPDTDYPAFTDPASPVYLDFASLRKDLTTLATLPDPLDAVELTFGKPSESVAYFRQMVDLAEGDVRSKGKPFKDTSTSGQKLIGLDTPWFTRFTPFALAMDKACKGFTLPPDTPVASQAANQIGQTVTLGDLHITLDKVATVAGEFGNLPAPGSRFLFVYATVENTGKANLSMNSFARSSLEDAAGKGYYMEPHTLMLHPAPAASLEGDIGAGVKGTGTLGYELPANVGDLLWVIQDNAQHRATFAIKASQIKLEGASLNSATEAAMRQSAGATMTAFFELVNTLGETEAAATETP